MHGADNDALRFEPTTRKRILAGSVLPLPAAKPQLHTFNDLFSAVHRRAKTATFIGLIQSRFPSDATGLNPKASS
jgi:hypothetical protein